MTTIYLSKDASLPARHEHDLYRTEKTLIHAALRKFLHLPGAFDRVLDIGAGDGRWGAIAADITGAKTVVGVELTYQDCPPTFTDWYSGQDFLTWDTDMTFDLIVSNPPYYCAEEIIRKAWAMLEPGGRMIMLLRLAFQSGMKRYAGLWHEIYPWKVAVCSRRPSFYGGGTNGTDYGIYLWLKDQDGYPKGRPWQWETELLPYDREPHIQMPKEGRHHHPVE